MGRKAVAKKPRFYELLRQRGLHISDLVCASGLGRSHLSKVLNDYVGEPPKHNRGKYARIKLYPWLTREEIDALGWTEHFLRWVAGVGDVKAPPQRFVHTMEGSFPAEELVETNGL